MTGEQDVKTFPDSKILQERYYHKKRIKYRL